MLGAGYAYDVLHHLENQCLVKRVALQSWFVVHASNCVMLFILFGYMRSVRVIVSVC